MELTKKQAFENDFYKNTLPPTKMVIAVKLPAGATELIINNEQIEQKFLYYMNAYDDDLKLKNNNEIQIIGYLFV